MPEGDYWTDREEKRLLDLVAEYGTDWGLISRKIKTRTRSAIRQKYYRLVGGSPSSSQSTPPRRPSSPYARSSYPDVEDDDDEEEDEEDEEDDEEDDSDDDIAPAKPMRFGLFAKPTSSSTSASFQASKPTSSTPGSSGAPLSGFGGQRPSTSNNASTPSQTPHAASAPKTALPPTSPAKQASVTSAPSAGFGSGFAKQPTTTRKPGMFQSPASSSANTASPSGSMGSFGSRPAHTSFGVAQNPSCTLQTKIFATSRFDGPSPPTPVPQPTTLPFRESANFDMDAKFHWSLWRELIPSTPNANGWFGSTTSFINYLPASVLAPGAYGVYEIAFSAVTLCVVHIGRSDSVGNDLRSIFARLHKDGGHLADLLLPYLKLGTKVFVRWCVTHGPPANAILDAQKLLEKRSSCFDYAFKESPLPSRPPIVKPDIYLLDKLLEQRRVSLSSVEKHICELLDTLNPAAQGSLLLMLQQHGTSIPTCLPSPPATSNASDDFIFPPPPPMKS